MSDPNFEMSLSEFLGQWGFTMDDARNVAERLGIFNLEELKNLGDDFFYHVNNYHEEQRSLKQEADDEFKWSEEDRIKRGISTDDYYKLNESKANETLKEDILNFIKIQGEMPAYSSMLRGLGIDIEESEVTRIIQELKAEGRIDTGFQNRTSQNYPEERSPWVKGGGHNYDSGEWTWKNNESKASEDLTFAGRGELNTIQDVWNAMSNDSRYSLMIKLGEYFDDGILQFVHGQKLTTIDIQRVIERDEFPDHLLGNIDVGYMKRVAGLESYASEWNSVEAIASEFYNDTGDAGRFLETPQLQQIRNHWDNVMPEEEKRSMLEGMAFLYKSSPTQKFDSLNWEVKESVALSVAGLVGLSIDMGTLYGKQHLDDLQNMYWD